jgi:uncharacterized protein (DUF1499 family)
MQAVRASTLSNQASKKRYALTTICLLGGAFGMLGVLAPVVGVVMARLDLITKLEGFNILANSAYIALLGLILSLPCLLLTINKPSWQRIWTLCGTLLGGAYAVFAISRFLVLNGVPPIHDIVTDLDNLAGLDSLEEWRHIHAESYADLKSLALNMDRAHAINAAIQLANQRGWVVVAIDMERGLLEATASVSLIGFQDDIVLRFVDTSNGCIVDMRSVSRVGVSDFGVNARRVREFLSDLKSIDT